MSDESVCPNFVCLNYVDDRYFTFLNGQIALPVYKCT